MVNWSSLVTHLLYTGIGGVTTGYTIDSLGPLHGSVLIIGFRGIMGAINSIWDDNSNAKKVYEFADKITWFFAFPLYVTHLWLEAGTRQEIAYLHPAFAIIPYSLYLADKDNEDASSALMMACALSASYITITRNNWFGLGATIIFAITHGVLRIDTDNSSVSKEDVFNILLAVYLALSAQGIVDA